MTDGVTTGGLAEMVAGRIARWGNDFETLHFNHSNRLVDSLFPIVNRSSYRS